MAVPKTRGAAETQSTQCGTGSSQARPAAPCAPAFPCTKATRTPICHAEVAGSSPVAPVSEPPGSRRFSFGGIPKLRDAMGCGWGRYSRAVVRFPRFLAPAEPRAAPSRSAVATTEPSTVPSGRSAYCSTSSAIRSRSAAVGDSSLNSPPAAERSSAASAAAPRAFRTRYDASASTRAGTTSDPVARRSSSAQAAWSGSFRTAAATSGPVSTTSVTARTPRPQAALRRLARRIRSPRRRARRS